MTKIQWKDIIDDPSSLDVDDQEYTTDNDDIKKDLHAFEAVSLN